MALKDKYKFNADMSAQWHYVDEKTPEDCDSCLAIAFDDISGEYWIFSGLYNEDEKRFYDGFGHLDLKDTVAWLSIQDDIAITNLAE